jgi:hypothetical protein
VSCLLLIGQFSPKIAVCEPTIFRVWNILIISIELTSHAICDLLRCYFVYPSCAGDFAWSTPHPWPSRVSRETSGSIRRRSRHDIDCFPGAHTHYNWWWGVAQEMLASSSHLSSALWGMRVLFWNLNVCSRFQISMSKQNNMMFGIPWRWRVGLRKFEATSPQWGGLTHPRSSPYVHLGCLENAAQCRPKPDFRTCWRRGWVTVHFTSKPIRERR